MEKKKLDSLFFLYFMWIPMMAVESFTGEYWFVWWAGVLVAVLMGILTNYLVGQRKTSNGKPLCHLGGAFISMGIAGFLISLLGVSPISVACSLAVTILMILPISSFPKIKERV